jgi:hypothetical protein
MITNGSHPSYMDPAFPQSYQKPQLTDPSNDYATALIGQYDLGRYFLGIGANAEVYLVESWVSSFGCVPEAMENLVLGVRPEDL